MISFICGILTTELIKLKVEWRLPGARRESGHREGGEGLTNDSWIESKRSGMLFHGRVDYPAHFNRR
jgi:hypothetical protein